MQDWLIRFALVYLWSILDFWGDLAWYRMFVVVYEYMFLDDVDYLVEELYFHYMQ
jgi:hypothetical protein